MAQKADVHYVDKIFTPGGIAQNTFIDRDSANPINRGLETVGHQILITGPFGSGKTSLAVNKADNLFSLSPYTICETKHTVDDLIDLAFQNLKTYTKTVLVDKSKKKVALTAKIKAYFAGIDASVSEERETDSKREPVSKLSPNAQLLAECFFETNQPWIIDNIHRIFKKELDGIAEILRTFQDTSGKLHSITPKIILVGTNLDYNTLYVKWPELKQRLISIELQYMKDTEIRKIIDKGFSSMNIEVPADTKDEIVYYSAGLPLVCHQICLEICRSNNLLDYQKVSYKLDYDKFKKGIKNFSNIYLAHLKIPIKNFANSFVDGVEANGQHILHILCEEGFYDIIIDELLEKIKDFYPKMTFFALNMLLTELQKPENGKLILVDSNNNICSLSDPLIPLAYTVFISSEQGDLATKKLSSAFREFMED